MSPLGKIPIVTSVMKGHLKILDAKCLNRLGLEPEMVQVLIKLSIEEKGSKDFVGLRQAALYTSMYWGTARFEEVQDIHIGAVSERGTSLQILIKKVRGIRTERLK